MENFDLKKYLIENKLTRLSLNEADEVDFKLTELNPDAKEIRNVMLQKGLKVTVSDGKGYNHTEKDQTAYIQLFNGNKSIEVGVDKSTNKVGEILNFIESNFKDKYNIEKGQNPSNWIIKMK